MKYSFAFLITLSFFFISGGTAYAETTDLSCYGYSLSGPGSVSITASPSTVTPGQPVTLTISSTGWLGCWASVGNSYYYGPNPTGIPIYYGGPYPSTGYMPSQPTSGTYVITSIGSTPGWTGASYHVPLPMAFPTEQVTVYPTQSGYWTAMVVQHDGGCVSFFCYDFYNYPTVSTYVNVVAGPDLTAGAPTPTTATVNVPVSLTATISNLGSNNAVGNTIYGYFDNWLFVSPNADGSNGTAIGEAWTAPLNAYSSEPASFPSYTFTSPGTQYVRACADLPPLWNGYVAESNEGNNCSAWTAVTVISQYQCSDGIDNDGNGKIDYPTDPGCSSPTDNVEYPIPSCSFSASPTSITTGHSSSLSWSCSNATSCTGTNFSTGGATSGGPTIVSPSSSTTYSLSCSGTGGSTNPSITVTVNPPGNLSLSALKPTVQPNTPASLSWSATNITADSCRITGTNGNSFPLSGSSGTRTTSALSTEATFTLSCTDLNGSSVSSAPVTVKITPKFQEF